MIGKHITNPKTRRSFSILNAYITGKFKGRPEGEKIAYTGCLNLASVETATLEMESLAFLNKRCKDPVMHLLLSWRENEHPSAEQAEEAVKITLDRFNLSQCQAVYALHQNTDNMHLHICVSRIDPETHRAIKAAGGWSRRGMEKAARQIERAQGWTPAENAWSEFNENGELVSKPVNIDIPTIPQKPSDMENLTGEQSAIRKAQEALMSGIDGIRDWGGLHDLMASNGMRYEKKGSGAVIHVGDIVVKASSVSRSLSLSKLEKRIGAYQPSSGTERQLTSKRTSSNSKPLDKSNDNPVWRSYIAERKIYYRDRKQLRKRLSMSQRKEKVAMKGRQFRERTELFASLRGKGFNRAYIAEQRSILASKHAYESAVLKESHAAAREALRKRRDMYSSYERWLKERGNIGEAEAWRHRKDSAFLQLEPPSPDSRESGSTEPKGILGFKMAVTKQGLRYYRESAPHEASFIDMGRLIRIYKQDDDTLLAALRLADEKWGGVKINGTDEYKRKCAEIAAKNGIRVVNLELSSIIKEFERKTQSPMSIEAARKTIEAEIVSQEAKHWNIWGAYNAHKKELEAIITNKPAKPKIFGIKKWRVDHGVWESERDRLLELIRSDLESLGVKLAHDGSDTDKTHREATARHEYYKKYVAEEARVSAQKELDRRFRASVLELAAKFGHDLPIITDAQDGRTYNGSVIGTAERDGSHYAVQVISKNRAILHHVEQDALPQIAALTGKEVEIKCVDWRIGAIVEETDRRERSRGWSR